MSVADDASALRVGKGGDEAATLERNRFSASLSVALILAVWFCRDGQIVVAVLARLIV